MTLFYITHTRGKKPTTNIDSSSFLSSIDVFLVIAVCITLLFPLLSSHVFYSFCFCFEAHKRFFLPCDTHYFSSLHKHGVCGNLLNIDDIYQPLSSLPLIEFLTYFLIMATSNDTTIKT